VLDGNSAVGCESGLDYLQIHIFQCMLERTVLITNEILEIIKFVLVQLTIFQLLRHYSLDTI
jgi:hypothetical protein